MSPRPTSKLVTGAAIDATGVIAEIDAEYSDELAIHIRGGETADYAVDVSPDGTNWFQDVTAYSGTAVDAVEDRPEAKIRIRVTTAAATAGTTADVYLAASPN